MNRFGINDAVVALVSAKAQWLGEADACVIPAGSLGTVVFVHSDGSNYEVEFPAGPKGWATAVLACVELDHLASGRIYLALVCEPTTETGRKVATVAPSLDDARQSLEAKYGAGSVLSVYNGQDAQRLREGDA